MRLERQVRDLWLSWLSDLYEIFCFQSETNGFADFHLYVCAAFLTRFSKDLLRERDFQVTIIHHINAECSGSVGRALDWGDQWVADSSFTAGGVAVLFPWARLFIPGRSSPIRYDWKFVDMDIKNQTKPTNMHTCKVHSLYNAMFEVHRNRLISESSYKGTILQRNL